MKQGLVFTTKRYKKISEDFELLYYLSEHITFDVGLQVPNSLAFVFNSFQHISSAFFASEKNQQFLEEQIQNSLAQPLPAIKDFFTQPLQCLCCTEVVWGCPEATLHRSSSEKAFWKQAANLQEDTHAEVWFP